MKSAIFAITFHADYAEVANEKYVAQLKNEIKETMEDVRERERERERTRKKMAKEGCDR